MISAAMLLGSLASAPPPMILHLRADTGLTTDANGRVLRWQDLSGRGTHFSSPILSGKRVDSLGPVVRTLPGKAQSVYFDGTRVLQDTTFLPLDSGFTLLALVQDSSPSSRSALLDKSKDDLGVNLWDSYGGYLTLSWSWSKAITVSNRSTTRPAVYAAAWDKATGKLWIDDTLVSTSMSSIPGTAMRNKSAWLGNVSYTKGVDGDLGYGLKGHIWEIRVYAGSLTDAQRSTIEESMRTGSLPPPDSGLMLHLHADKGLVLDASGDEIVSWGDLSPRMARFSAPSPALRPSFVPEGIGGRPALRFSGADALQDSSSLPLDSGCTVFIVAQDSSGKNAQSGLLDKGANDLAMALWGGAAGNLTFGYSWLQGIVSSQRDTAAPALFGATWDRRHARLFVDGKLVDSATDSMTGKYGVRNRITTLGAIEYGGGINHFLTGHVAEVRVYRFAMGELRRKLIEDSLITRYRLGKGSATPTGLKRPSKIRPGLTVLPDGSIRLGAAVPVSLMSTAGRRIPFSLRKEEAGIRLVPGIALPNGLYVVQTAAGSEHVAVFAR